MVYVVRDREAGNVIEYCKTLEEAESTVMVYEDADKDDGIYTPNFYEIVEEEDDGFVKEYEVVEIEDDDCGFIDEADWPIGGML